MHRINSNIGKDFSLDRRSVKYRRVLPGDIIQIFVDDGHSIINEKGRFVEYVKKAYCIYDRKKDGFRDITTLEYYILASDIYTLVREGPTRSLKHSKEIASNGAQFKLKLIF